MGHAPTQLAATQLILCTGAGRAAIAADGVAEVIRSPKITRLPYGPPDLLGVSHLRGVVFPVLSLNALLGATEAETKRVVVLRRDPPVGLAVEWVETLKTDAAAPKAGDLTLVEAHGARRFDLDAALQARFAGVKTVARSPQITVSSPSPLAVSDELTFMGVTVACQAYALPLAAIAEVAAAPDAIVALPNTEAVLLGMLAVRGRVLAVVSLRALLGLTPRSIRSADRLVVVRIGDHRLALVVDEITAILRAPADAARPAPSLFNRGAGEAAIASVLPSDDGQGLVSILDPERLLADHRLACLLAQPLHPEDEAMASPVAAYERFLIVRLGQESYGLPIARIDEVARLPDTLTRLPRAPDYVLGVMNLRGRIIPVIDQGRRFSATGVETGAARRVVVASFGALQAGFAVDAVSRIIEIDPAAIQATPSVTEGADRVIDRVARVEADGEVILLIDPKVLLDGAEADLLRRLSAKSEIS